MTAGAGSQYELGHYLEDYEYLADFGMTQGVDFDLDEHNGRFCVTPEFPNGTYAYFTSIEPDGTPKFPYSIGRTYYGNPTANTVGAVPNDAEIVFEGGPEMEESMDSLSIDGGNGDVTITWDAVQGGNYKVEYSDDLNTWTEMPGMVLATSGTASATDPAAAIAEERRFYRTTRMSLEPFDGNGFDYDDGGGNPGGGNGAFDATFPTQPPIPPESAVTSITVGGVTATITSYNQPTGEVSLEFDDSSLAPGSYPAILTFTPPGQAPRMVTSTNQYTVNQPPAQNNVLLMIVDDWGIDSSPVDNPAGPRHASMPTLANLAAGGLRFTNAHALPVCSPTRATIITGRYAFRHGVGSPGGANVTAGEFTLPEAFAAATSPYSLASFGKWHLGGGNNGPNNLGGWPEFAGIAGNGGGVGDYELWNKNENGTVTNDVTTYTTTDQVNEAVDFITAQGDNPWFCWLAFNAPHTPFHEPPSDLLPSNPTGTANRDLYEKALEALDTEMARLLLSVDMATTNIIIIGDNGTPNQVVQAPFGNGHAKGDLYQGGVHVPMIATGPDITATETTDELVHCVDLFSTILELAGIDPSSVVPGGTTIDSRNLVPVLQGNDITDGCLVFEVFGTDINNPGRAIRDGDYKLIIFDDPNSAVDVPDFEFYNVATDVNEQNDLLDGTLNPTEQAAFDALMAKNTTLGGNFGVVPGNLQDVYIELPNPGTPNVPQLINNNNNAVHPMSITIGGQPASFENGTRPDGNPESRVDSTGTPDRYWVKALVDPVAAGLAPGTYNMVVEFRPAPQTGNERIYTALNTFTVN